MTILKHYNGCLMKREKELSSASITASFTSPRPFLTTASLIYIPRLLLLLYSSLCATEWCDSREQTMSGYPGNLGRRTEVSWTGRVPPPCTAWVPLMIHRPAWWRLVTPIWVRLEEEERAEEGGWRNGDNKEEGMAMPTSVALANRQMSLSLTQVNHVSWGKE